MATTHAIGQKQSARASLQLREGDDDNAHRRELYSCSAAVWCGGVAVMRADLLAVLRNLGMGVGRQLAQLLGIERARLVELALELLDAEGGLALHLRLARLLLERHLCNSSSRN